METYDSITVGIGKRPLVIGADRQVSLSDGCGRVWWDIEVPSWHNDVRYYRDVVGYVGLEVWRTTTCATCDGTGRVPYERDRNKPAWARRTKRCPTHAPTHTTPESVCAIPCLKTVLRTN